LYNDIKNLISSTKPFRLKLSVIIINFNVKYFLEQCLCSVTNACKNIEAEIFVIDNLSTDDSKEYFKGKFKEVHFIWNPENVGFSKANNQVLKLATGEFILFLNPDTILPEDCLAKCIACFNNNIDAGALGVRMIDGAGKFLKESKRGFPSPLVSLFKLSGLTAIFPRSKFFARYYLGHLNQYKNQQVDVLSGAFMMIRKRVLDITGGFDERFFMYGEDIDLSYRILRAGYQNIYFAETTIIHFKGESTKKNSPKYIKLFYGAMSIFVKKHYGENFAGLYNFLIQIVIAIKSPFLNILNSLRQSTDDKKKLNKREKYLILGDKKAFAVVESILQKNNIDSLVYNHVDLNGISIENNTEIFKHLPPFANDRSINEMIICVDDFSAKQTIALIELLPVGLNLRFHFANSNCIVGSNRKDSSGDIIA
jgi:GT2 family glycosyltransferase